MQEIYMQSNALEVKLKMRNDIYEKEKSSKSDMKILLIVVRCQVRSNYINTRKLTTSKEGAILRKTPKKMAVKIIYC